MWLVIAAVVVLVVLVMGNRDTSEEPASAGPLDAAAKQTCDEFSEAYPKARSKVARLSLADRAMVASRRSENDAIARQAGELGHATDDGAQWKSTADALLDACRTAGWTAL